MNPLLTEHAFHLPLNKGGRDDPTLPFYLQC